MKQTYHILNRGVEKRKIFLKNRDYLRFVHNLSDFNDEDRAMLSYRNRRQRIKNNNSDVGRPKKEHVKKNIIEMLAWTLMPNHVHIMAQEEDIGGAGKYSRKIFGGYTKYFNEQNDRTGVLFQGKSKIILIQDYAHFLYLPFYIHLNPLDLFDPGWREYGIKNTNEAIAFLEEYRWSNYRDIIGKGNQEFADSTNKECFFEIFETNEKKYKKDFEEWVKGRGYKETQEFE